KICPKLGGCSVQYRSDTDRGQIQVQNVPYFLESQPVVVAQLEDKQVTLAVVSGQYDLKRVFDFVQGQGLRRHCNWSAIQSTRHIFESRRVALLIDELIQRESYLGPLESLGFAKVVPHDVYRDHREIRAEGVLRGAGKLTKRPIVVVDQAAIHLLNQVFHLIVGE